MDMSENGARNAFRTASGTGAPPQPLPRRTKGRIAVTASRPIGGTKNEARRLLGAGDEGTEA